MRPVLARKTSVKPKIQVVYSNLASALTIGKCFAKEAFSGRNHTTYHLVIYWTIPYVQITADATGSGCHGFLTAGVGEER